MSQQKGYANVSSTDSDCLVPSLHPALCIQQCKEDDFAVAFYNSVDYFNKKRALKVYMLMYMYMYVNVYVNV